MEEETNRRIIYEVILDRFQQISVDKNGFLVVQKRINLCLSDEWRLNLIASIIANTSKLINDEYGNFVI